MRSKFTHLAKASALAIAETAHARLFSLMVATGAVSFFGPQVRNLQAKQADLVTQMAALNKAAEEADRDFTAEEQARYTDLKAQHEAYKGRIARAQEQELMEAGMPAAAPANSPARHEPGIVIPAASRIVVSESVENDPNRGFRSFGEYAVAVRAASLSQRTGMAMDRRLIPLSPAAAAPGTFGGEGGGADGGIAVPPGFSENIFRLSLGEESLLPLTDNTPIEGNSMLFPKDETTPWGSNGVRAYWQGEGSAGTPTKPSLGGLDLRLQKLLALVAMSDELLADQTALTAYLPDKIADSVRWKINEAILFGSGSGVPLGALLGAAVITQPKDSGQATNTLSVTNLANMMSRLPPGSFPKSVWIINNNVLPSLFTLTLGNFPIYLPSGLNVGGLQISPYGTLMGRPIIISQHAASFSSQGDVILVDLSYYQAITKAEGMQTATSMHLYFDADAAAFRTTFRMGGMPKLAAPISPAKGSTTLSPFVQLQAR